MSRPKLKIANVLGGDFVPPPGAHLTVQIASGGLITDDYSFLLGLEAEYGGREYAITEATAQTIDGERAVELKLTTTYEQALHDRLDVALAGFASQLAPAQLQAFHAFLAFLREEGRPVGDVARGRREIEAAMREAVRGAGRVSRGDVEARYDPRTVKGC